MERRGFLKFFSKLAVVIGSLGTGIYSFFRLFVPDVLYEPPKRFALRKPEEFPEGVTFIKEHRLFIIRTGNEFYCISAICQHLGCTVNYKLLPEEKEIKFGGRIIKEEWEFACPCHGSTYYGDGTVYSGPAPKSLEWFELDISPETGEIIVKTDVLVDRSFRLKV